MDRTRFLFFVCILFITLICSSFVVYAHHPSESICKGGYCECEGNGGPGGDSPADPPGGGNRGNFPGGNSGNCAGGFCKTGIPNLSVSMTNLNLTITDTPVAYTPALGPEVRFTTTYNSVGSYYAGPLGYYWTHNYNIYLALNPPYVTLNKAGGTEYQYYCPGVGVCTSPAGIFDILTKNADNTYTLETKDQTRYEFNSSGKLEEIADRNDNDLDLVYNDTGLCQIIDAKGRTTTIDYNDTGLIERVTIPDGRFAEFTYNNSELIQVIDEAGQVLSYTYDTLGNHLIESLSNPKMDIDISYQLGDRIYQITGDLTRTYTWGSLVAYITDANGKQTDYYFQDWDYSSGGSRRRITKVQAGLANSVLYQYDSGNTVNKKTDANGKAAEYLNDSRGNRIYEKDPMGYETHYTYDERNNLTSVTNPRGKKTIYTYGDYDNILSITEKAPDESVLSTITYTYTDARFPYLKTSVTDANGKIITYAYDEYGRLEQIDAPELAPVTFGYDNGNDRKTSMTNANGTTTYEYDNLDRITKITHPDATFRLYVYDCCGLSQLTDENGKTTYYEYNVFGQVTKVTDPEHGAEHPTIYQYDDVGNLRFLIDAEGNTTEYQYNDINRLTSITYPLGDSESYTYDANGNMLTKTDGKGATTTYTYDANNRLIKVVPGEVQQ